MKKFIKLTLFTVTLTALLSLTGFAKTGDIIGYAKYTDISAYINHYPITSYNINGNTAVIAEDLANYGFDVAWDGNARTLTVTRGNATTITPYGNVYKHSDKVGQNSFPIYSTDIVTYVNNAPVTSFAIGGKTCVYIDSLTPYGELNWIPEQRATKLWLSGLPTAEYKTLKEAPDGTRQKPYNLGDTISFDFWYYDEANGTCTLTLNEFLSPSEAKNKYGSNILTSNNLFGIIGHIKLNNYSSSESCSDIIYSAEAVTNTLKPMGNYSWYHSVSNLFDHGIELYSGGETDCYIPIHQENLNENETIEYFTITYRSGSWYDDKKTIWFSLK